MRSRWKPDNRGIYISFHGPVEPFTVFVDSRKRKIISGNSDFILCVVVAGKMVQIIPGRNVNTKHAQQNDRSYFLHKLLHHLPVVCAKIVKFAKCNLVARELRGF